MQGLERIRVRVTHGVPLICAGVRALLAGSNEFVIAESTEAADVLIADMESGLRALGSGSGRSVLIVAHDDGEASIRKALGMGVKGLVLPTCAAEELLAAVRTVSRGGTIFSPDVASRIVHSFASEPLTDRELEVLQLMVHGFPDKDIARHLAIALGTVKSHMKSILMKLGASRRTEAAAIAQRRGIARLDSPVVTLRPLRMAEGVMRSAGRTL